MSSSGSVVPKAAVPGIYILHSTATNIYTIYTISTLSTQYLLNIHILSTQCGHVCREAAVPGIYILHSTATTIASSDSGCSCREIVAQCVVLRPPFIILTLRRPHSGHILFYMNIEYYWQILNNSDVTFSLPF